MGRGQRHGAANADGYRTVEDRSRGAAAGPRGKGSGKGNRIGGSGGGKTGDSGAGSRRDEWFCGRCGVGNFTDRGNCRACNNLAPYKFRRNQNNAGTNPKQQTGGSSAKEQDLARQLREKDKELAELRKTVKPEAPVAMEEDEDPEHRIQEEIRQHEEAIRTFKGNEAAVGFHQSRLDALKLQKTANMSESAQLGRADQHITWAKDKLDAAEDRAERLHKEWAEVQARWREELQAAEDSKNKKRTAYQDKLREKEALKSRIGGPSSAGSGTAAAAAPVAADVAAAALAQLAGNVGEGLAPGVREALQELAAKQAAHLAAATAAAATAAAAAAAEAANQPPGQQPTPTVAVEAPAGDAAASNQAVAEQSEEEKKAAAEAAAAEEKAAAEAATRCDELFARLAGEEHDPRVLELLSGRLGGRSAPY